MEEVQIEPQTRHKKKLASIRESGDKNNVIGAAESSGGGESRNRRHTETSERSVQPAADPDERIFPADRHGTEGVQSSEGDTRGYGQGVRPFDTASIDPASRIDRIDYENTGELAPVELSEEEKRERERELARQRKQRQRDREKAEKSPETVLFPVDLSSERDRDRDTAGHAYDPATSRFNIKNPLKLLDREPDKVKLFTNKEAEIEQERLSYIYFKASGLIDDLLEIIVKGHEPVSIWQIDEGEADMLASLHLEKAKIDQNAARSARVLLSIYDRLFTIMLVGPRLGATGQHVKSHGGLSFK